MKKILYTVAVMGVSIYMTAQKNQVQNAYSALQNKEFDKGKIAVDLAAENEQTKGSAKLWMYRGKIYMGIYEDKGQYKALDSEAEEKAVSAFVTCLKLDKDNIYKDEVKGPLVQSAFSLNRKAGIARDNKEYEKSIKAYDILLEAVPFDDQQSLKRNNITKENIIFNKYRTYAASGNKEKTKEYIQLLIDMKYKDPSLYLNMSKQYLEEKDTAKALSYIESGRALFEDNNDLINQEINIYLAQKRLDVLKEKLKTAVEVSPDNEIMHGILGLVYSKTGEPAKAEESYKKAIELKPDYEMPNYNLGVLYYSNGKEWNDKYNNLPPKETQKAKEYQEKAVAEFKKAVEYLEKSYEISPDKRTKQTLFQLYNRLGDTEKAAKYKG